MSSVTDMTRGKPLQLILRFTLPLFVGNLFQQLYNVVDSIVVGRFVSKDALAAVGASFSLMNFITAILIGICMGCGVVFSQYFGAGDIPRLKRAVSTALLFAGGLTVALTALSLAFAGPLLRLIQIPEEIFELTRGYILIIFGGLPFVFLYNAGAFLLRSLGNSKVPLYFLILSTALNIVLDLLFVVGFGMGVQGAALATVAAQAVSSVCCILYCLKKLTLLRYAKGEFCFDRAIFGKIASYGVLTSVQQSIMNLGILAVQGIVNTFGTNVIAAFTVAVKIEAFAYLPVQDFGNAFSTYVAQNKGGGRMDRIRPHRLSLHALRLLPRAGRPAHVHPADGDFAGTAGGAGGRPLDSLRPGGHLVVDPHRLALRRLGGLCQDGPLPAGGRRGRFAQKGGVNPVYSTPCAGGGGAGNIKVYE